MATGLHAHRGGVDPLASPLHPATTRGRQSIPPPAQCSSQKEKVKGKAKSTQQSGEHHAVVSGRDKSIQKKKGTIPSSTVTQREKPQRGKLTG